MGVSAIPWRKMGRVSHHRPGGGLLGPTELCPNPSLLLLADRASGWKSSRVATARGGGELEGEMSQMVANQKLTIY